MKKLSAVLVFLLLSFKIFSQSANLNDSVNSYLTLHHDSLNPIEGIWNITTTQEYYHFDTLVEVVTLPERSVIALLKKEKVFKSFNISGQSYEVEFISTDVKGVYLFRNYFQQANEYSKSQAVICKGGEMEYTYDLPDDYLKTKLGDKYKAGIRIVNILKWKKTPPLN